MKSNPLWLLIFFPCLAAAADEVIVPLTIDTNLSRLELTLRVQSQSDSDVQPLAGSMQLAVTGLLPMETVSLHDFHLRALRNFNFNLNFGVGGAIAATVTNLQIYHAEPGPVQASQTVTNGNVIFRDIPSSLEGRVAYVANGFVCFALLTAELPCDDMIELGTIDEGLTIREWPVLLTLTNNLLRLTGVFVFTNDISPAMPELGQISGRATISATGLVAPTLRIQPGEAPNQHRVSWPAAFEDFRLYRAPSLAPGSAWVLAEPTLVTTNTGTVSAIFTNGPAPAFYRLSNE